MNKSDLIEAISNELDLPKATVTKVVNAYHQTVQTAMSQGDKVTLPGFGTFQVSERKERSGRNPRTGESLVIAAAKIVKFRPGKDIKTNVG